MRVASVSVRDFRNYEAAAAPLGGGLTVVCGPNGAGKSNLLEAVYFGCTGRSCRTGNDRELVRFGTDTTRVVVTAEDELGVARTDRRLLTRGAEAHDRRRRAGRAAARRTAATAGQRLPARPAGADQGRAGAAARSPRPVRDRALAGQSRHPPRICAGIGAAQRVDRPAAGRPRLARDARRLGRTAGRGGPCS